MGYVIVGMIAFLLGIMVSLLCIHIKGTKMTEKDK